MAVACRRDRQVVEPEGGESLLEEQVGDVDKEEQETSLDELDENLNDNMGQDGLQRIECTTRHRFGLMSKSSWYEYVKILEFEVCEKTEVEISDILVKLILDLSGFNKDKIGVNVQRKEADLYLKKKLSKYSDYMLRSKVVQLKNILLGAKEPELLLEWLIKKLINSPTQLCLLQQAGIILDETMFTRRRNATEVAGKLAIEFVAKRRSGQAYSKVSLDHALATVHETG